MSSASGHRQFDKRDEELEQLHKLVRDFELEARGGHRRRGRDNQEGRSDSRENHYGTGSNQSGSRQHRDHSHSQESRRRRDRSHSQESR